MPVIPIVAGPELLAVQRAAYCVEAALLGTDAIPPLHDTLDSLVAADLRWFGYVDRTALLGAVAVTTADGVLDIDRLVVDPAAFRRGVGSALVTYVLALTKGPVTVSTGRANTPARALYESMGFRVSGEVEVEPGLWVTHHLRAGG